MFCSEAMMQKTSVLIIGAGPAGLTTALQLKRFGMSFLLFEGKQIGGLLQNANWVENYPGFPKGIRGEKLAGLFKKQIEHLGIEILAEDVLSLQYKNGFFTARTKKTKKTCQDSIKMNITPKSPLLPVGRSHVNLVMR